MSLKADNLSSVGSVHFIKGASNPVIGEPRNVRGVCKSPASVEQDVNKPVCDFNFWRNVKQLNHRIHFASSLCEGVANVTKCKVWQDNSIMKVLKGLDFFKAPLTSAAFARCFS